MDDKFIAPVSDQEDKGSFVAPSADIEGGAKKKSGNIIIIDLLGAVVSLYH